MSRNIVNEQKTESIKSIFETDLDDLINEAVKVVTQYDRASASLIQRRLAIGYARAARMMDQLEALGVVGRSESGEPREVLIKNPDEVKGIKPKKEVEYIEPELKYKTPKLSIISKPKQNPWKHALSAVANKLGEDETLTFPLGFNESGKLVLGNLKELGSLIISGNIWSNKEVFMDTLLTSLILKNSPKSLRLALVDESRYLNFYDSLQHELTPVINDLEKSVSAIRWAISEQFRRLKIFAEAKVRSIEDYNASSKNKLPDILFVINQVENLFDVYKDESVSGIKQITLKGHIAGIHLVLTSNRLTVKEIPAEIQSDISCKIMFRMTSNNDAGQLKGVGVEKLEPGEIIFMNEGKSEKLEAVYTSEDNVKGVVKEIVSQK